jgi:hypothetical protein
MDVAQTTRFTRIDGKVMKPLRSSGITRQFVQALTAFAREHDTMVGEHIECAEMQFEALGLGDSYSQGFGLHGL